MIIGNNTVVECHYTLREATADGELIESTEGGHPLSYIQGIGMMIPTFEENLAGKTTGDSFSFGIKAADAYGEYDEHAVTVIPISAFNLGTENPADVFIEGQMLPLTNENDEHMEGMVAHVTETDVTIDFNHPMAGIDLYFIGKVEAIREATSEELDHGHIHGEGGVEHDH
jgi:FKBP-type peptidyl-prolyl cis-trans isomerase SlyD